MVSSLKQYRDLALVLLVVAIGWFGFLDQYAETYIDASLATSTVSFGLARLFNGTVSVLSTITLNVPIVGSIQVGELLDPLNDLVEDFSTVMKYAISSLLIQKFLVEITQTLHFKLLLTLSAMAYVFARFFWLSQRVLAYRIFVFAFACKFSIVLVALASGWVDQAFVQAKIEEANKALEAFPVKPDQLDGLLDLSSEMRDQAAKDIVLEENRKSLLVRQRQTLILDRNERQAELDTVTQQLASVNQKEGVFTSLVNRTEEQKRLGGQQDSLQRELASVEGIIEDIENEVGRIDRDIRRLKRRVNNEMGTFESLINGFNRVTTAAKDKVIGYVDVLNEAMGSFLNLMALFVLKTVIIPLIFLFAMYKVFVNIWRMTPKEVVLIAKEKVKDTTS